MQRLLKSVEDWEVVCVRGAQMCKSLKYGNYQCVRDFEGARIFSVFGGFGHLQNSRAGKNIFRPSKISYLLLNI